MKKIFNDINPARGLGFLLILLLFSFYGSAQNPERKYLGYEKEENSVTVQTGDGEYRFIIYTPEIVETSFIPSGEPFIKESYAVILEPESVKLTIQENNDSLTVDSDGINITISKNPFQITYYYNGEKVISEKSGYSKGNESEKIDFNIQEDEMLFGGGASALGMNRRGNRLQFYNQPYYENKETSELINFTLPIVFSSEKYMIHFDNAFTGFLDLDSEKTNTVAYETVSGRKTYRLIVGDSWEKLIGNYTLLTGRQPMLPRWALGNLSTSDGYRTQKEITETVQKFKEASIPVDAVIIDPYLPGNEVKNRKENLQFPQDSFPEPEKMIAGLKDLGIKTILVTEPFILTASNRWEEAVKNEFLVTDASGQPLTYNFHFGKTGLVNIFKPEARNWFWNIYKELAASGVAGWWGDFKKPEDYPSKVQKVKGRTDENRNIHSHTWAKMIYEGYQEDFPNQRPFILMPDGAVGSQRFGMILLSRDNDTTRRGFKSHPEIALQMGIQGLAYMYSEPNWTAGDNVDDEFYIRWLQYGVFQPIFLWHAPSKVLSEPTFWGSGKKELAKKAIELRYRLLPYNYNLSFENSRNGLPLMRPLFFEEPENKEIYNVATTYLWGKEFLISPVMDTAIAVKEIYFPGTNNWFDFYSGTKYNGGNYHSISVKGDHIPTFVRGGAFVPMAKPLQTTANYSAANLEVHYYYDTEVKESSARVYHDDGEISNSFEKGKYEILNLSSSSTENSLTITVEKEEGENSDSEIQMVEVIIENLQKPVDVVWVKTLRFTSKNFMHQGKLVIPVRFDQPLTTIKLEFN